MISRSLLVELGDFNEIATRDSLVAGKTALEFTFAVVENLDNIFILGNDFRAHFHVSIPSTNCIDFPWKRGVQCRTEKRQGKILLVAREEIVYPARCIVIERLPVNDVEEQSCYRIEPVDDHVLLARGIGSVADQGTLLVKVVNPKTKEVRIPKGTVRGSQRGQQNIMEKSLLLIDMTGIRHCHTYQGWTGRLSKESQYHEWQPMP